MLIDEFVPEYDFRSRHSTTVLAPTDAVRRAVHEWRPEESFLWRLLLRLRGLGGAHGTLREWADAMGFLCLAETENELLYGQIGRFWAFDERGALVSPRTVEEFRQFDDPRFAAAVMALWTEAKGGAKTVIHTETRDHCLGSGARRRFRLYWLIIERFSGLLRGAMLRGMKAHAAAHAARGYEQRERSV